MVMAGRDWGVTMSIGTTDRRGARRGHKVEQPAVAPAPPDPVVAAVASDVAQVERQRLAWAQVADGADGERVTTSALALLGRYGWTTLEERPPRVPELHDVHVAVGPGGVVVVAERAWTGHVVVEGGVLRHDGFRCERDLEQLAAAVDALTSLLPVDQRAPVLGVIHVTPRDLPPAMCGGALVVGRLHLASTLVNLPQRLTPMEVADIARWLARSVETPVTPLASSGGAAVSNGTVFYPGSAADGGTSAYFVPRQPTGPAPVGPVGPVAPVAPVRTGIGRDYDDATWALLYPTSNRFGIR